MTFDNEKFRKKRKELRWSLDALANELSVTRKTIYNWENGLTSPNEKRLFNISKLFKTPCHELIRDNSNYEEKIKSRDSKTKKLHSLFYQKQFYQKEIKESTRAINLLNDKLNNAYLLVNGIFSAANFSVYIKNTKQQYIMVNHAFLKNLSLEKDFSFKGKKDYAFFAKQEATENYSEDVKVMLSQKEISNKKGYIPGSKKKKTGLISKIPISDENDNVIGLIGIFVNIK